MERMAILLASLVIAVAMLIGVALFAEQIHAKVPRRVERALLQSDNLLFWAALGLTAFTLGLIVMYLVLRG
jgi:predicted cobalt transporter CbtA